MRRLALVTVLAVASLAPVLTVPRPAAAAAASTYYFAEGTTRADFMELLHFYNPSSAAPAITVTIEYDYADGTAPVTTAHGVPALDTLTVSVGDLTEAGPDKDVSVVVTGTGPFAASREVIAFRHPFGGAATVSGASALAGIASPATEWNLAEGSTLPGFQEYLTLQNPATATAAVSVSYGFEGVPGRTATVSVAPRSRATIDVNAPDQAGPGQTGVSARVLSTNGVPILVERPLYFNRDFPGLPAVNGASDAAGAAPSPSFFFAEGNVLDGWDEFLTLFNPLTATQTATVQYLLEGAPPQTKAYSVAAGSRLTVQVFDAAQGVGRSATAAPSRGVSMHVTAPDGVVAERPLYMRADVGGGPFAGGNDAVGATGTAGCALFAFGESSTDSVTFLTLSNPSASPVDVAIRQNAGALGATTTATIPAESRLTVNLNGTGFAATSYGVTITAGGGGQFIAEEPLYRADPRGGFAGGGVPIYPEDVSATAC